jgi:hypothetical protein
VAVERLFNKGIDLSGLRRHSLSAETEKADIIERYIYKEGNFLKGLFFMSNL